MTTTTTITFEPNPADADVIDVDVDGVIAGAIATDGVASGFITQRTHVALMTSLRRERASVDDIKRIITLRVQCAAELHDGAVDIGDGEFLVCHKGVIMSVVFDMSTRVGTFTPRYDASVVSTNGAIVIERYRQPSIDNALSAARIAHGTLVAS